jgi:hypothetical protein
MSSVVEQSTFDQLVKSLDSDERRSLLDKLLAAAQVSDAPLKQNIEEDEAIDLKVEYQRLSLLRRLVLILRALLSGRDRFQVFEEMLLLRVQAIVERRAPGLIDTREQVFTELMHSRLLELQARLHILRGLLELAIHKERAEFIAFLAGVELQDVQRQLEAAADAARQWDGQADLDSGALKNDMQRLCDTILNQIPKDQRRRVYMDVQTLTALTRLALHPFSSMLACFRRIPSGESERYSEFSEIGKYMVSLSEALAAAQYPPSGEALRALLIYSYKNRLLDETFPLESELDEDLTSVKQALAAIRHFNDTVPVTLLVKLSTRNLSFRPREPGGSEDWFALFRGFWQRRIARAHALFYWDHKSRLLARMASDFLGTRALPELDTYRTALFEGMEPRHHISLSFLKGFARKVFPRIEKPLRIIVTSGEFYRPENKNELNDALVYLGAIDENLINLEGRLQPEGDLGGRLFEVRSERQDPARRIRLIRDVLRQADTNASFLVAECVKKLANIERVIEGVLRSAPGERYDSLANMGTIGGVGNKLLVATWGDVLDQIRNALSILRRIRSLEDSAER